jgi:hypothetical protein
MIAAPDTDLRAAGCRRALAAVAVVHLADACRLALVLPDGRRTPLRLAVDGAWAELTAGLPAKTAPPDPWEALAVVAAVEGTARLALTPGERAFELRADVAVDDDADPAPRLAAACGDMRALAAALSGQPAIADDAHGAPAAGDRRRSGGGGGLCAALSETGWSFVERGPDRVAVDLAIPDRFQQAFVTPAAGGRTLARATLSVCAAPTLASRRAIGVLLLTASAVVRLVRAGVAAEGTDVRVFVEALLDPVPAAGDLDAALGALAMACRMAGRETRALLDERVARNYLAARGWAA